MSILSLFTILATIFSLFTILAMIFALLAILATFFSLFTRFVTILSLFRHARCDLLIREGWFVRFTIGAAKQRIVICLLADVCVRPGIVGRAVVIGASSLTLTMSLRHRA